MSRPVFLLLLATALTWADPFTDSVKPFLRTHCSGCHSGKTPAGAFAVSELLTPSAPASLRARDRWERVAQRIATGEMPPKDSPRPPATHAKEITTWVATTYAELDRKTPIDPGRVTARRLNRFEYSNSVRDLLGLDLNPGEDFPVDPFGYGFDNIGDVLSMNAGMTEQYLKASERIAQSAVPVPGEAIPATMRLYLAERVGQDRQLRLHIDHVFPVEGDYTLRTAFYQALKDGTRVRIRLFLDGKEVGNEELRFYYQIDRAAEARWPSPRRGLHRSHHRQALQRHPALPRIPASLRTHPWLRPNQQPLLHLYRTHPRLRPADPDPTGPQGLPPPRHRPRNG